MSDPVDSDRNREHDLEPEWDPSAHRLPVWATIREAVQAIGKEWKALLKAVAVPALVLTAVIVVLDGEYLGSLEDILLYLLSLGLLTMIAVSCHRLVILGADSLPNAWGLFWSGRETRFLGWIYGIWIIATIPLALPRTLDPGPSPLHRHSRRVATFGDSFSSGAVCTCAI